VDTNVFDLTEDELVKLKASDNKEQQKNRDKNTHLDDGESKKLE